MNRLAVPKTYKLYVGGAFVRSESGRYDRHDDRNVPRASRKDVRDAVAAARKAAGPWAARTAYNRGQILYRAAEALESRAADFAVERGEVEAAIDVLVQAFARFVIDGFGTPAPVAPTDELVVGGLYRHVRNPMYVAVVAIIAGQALVFGQELLLVYAGAMWAVFAGFVRVYEEPTLLATYGDQYEAYRRSVPAWLPRLR